MEGANINNCHDGEIPRNVPLELRVATIVLFSGKIKKLALFPVIKMNSEHSY